MSQFQNDSPHKIPKPSSEVNTPHLSSFHSDDETNPNLSPDSPREPINTINLHEAIRTAQENNEIRTSDNPPVDHLDKEAKAAETLYTEENHQSEVQQQELGSVRHLLKEGRQIQNNDEEGKPLKKDAAVIQMPPAVELAKRHSSIRNNAPQKHQHRRFPAVLLCGFLSFYYLSVLGLLLYLLVTHMTDRRYNLQATAGALDYMGMNLDNNPIIAISLAAQGSRCSGNFESVRLSTWPSSREGCYKLDKNVLVPSLCDGMDLEENYFSIYKQNLYSWKGYQFCIQRAVRNKDYVLAATCPATYNKECSPGICMKSTVECPITSLSIEGTAVQNGESIAHGASNYLNIERQQGEQPLVNITASVGGLPCFSTINQPAVSEPYVAINDQPEGCLVYGIDQGSFIIDTDTQLNLLESNNVKSDIMNLTGYKAGVNKINVVLAGRKRIEVEPTNLCLNANTNKMHNPGEDSARLRLAVSALTSISLICHFLVGMTMMNLMCGRLWVKISLRDLIWERKNLYKILMVWFIFLEVFALALLTVFVNMYKDGIRNSESYFQDLIAMNCFGTDSQASSILANYNEYVNNNVSSLLIYVFLCCGISLVFMGIIIFTLCYMAKLYQKAHKDIIFPRLMRVQSSH